MQGASRRDDEDDARGALAPSTAESTSPCDVCGGPTFEVRCKITCRRCGFTRDCSDP